MISTRLLHKLRNKPRLHACARYAYANTIGLGWLKRIYLQKVGFSTGTRRVTLVANSETNDIVQTAILSRRPYMLSRYGNTEFKCLFTDSEFPALANNAGFFPADPSLLPEFRKIYLEASGSIDDLCVWNYELYFNWKREWVRGLPNIQHFLPLSVVGPSQPWIQTLSDMKVLIVHPFKQTIESQYAIMQKHGLLPSFRSLTVFRAVQTIAGNRDPRFKTWFDALAWMQAEIAKLDFDVALIGAGAYGLPLAAHIKSTGRQAIHIGGSLQLYFGIMGKRWERSELEGLHNHWVRPFPQDTPQGCGLVESGCYW